MCAVKCTIIRKDTENSNSMARMKGSVGSDATVGAGRGGGI